MMTLTLSLLTAVFTAFGGATMLDQGDRAADRKAVEQAALDYVEALYLADPARIERSVHPQLTMTYEQLMALAKKWNADGKQKTLPKQVDIYEVLDQTASAKVTASWGIDYLQLAKYDGRWKIVNILWQAHPR